jgi:hypothetical protein
MGKLSAEGALEMEGRAKRKIIVGAAAALAVAGGGAAIASTQLGSPREESRAILNDAAKQLGIEPSKLSDALKTAFKNRVDAAVEAGRLTSEQGAALKARIDAAEYPILFGAPRGFGHFRHAGHFADLRVAASYLEVTPETLRAELRAGKTLAQIARDKGKSVDGLVGALVAAAKERLDAAVGAGRLTEQQRATILAELEQRITGLVNAPPLPAFGRHGLRGPGFFGGPRLHRLRGLPPPPRVS